MKAILLLLQFSIAISASSHAENEKSKLLYEHFVTSSTNELIIGVPNFNMKRYDEFVRSVSSITGILNLEYCSQQQVFLVNYDANVFSSPEEVFKLISEKLNSFKIYFKTGATHAQLKENC